MPSRYRRMYGGYGRYNGSADNYQILDRDRMRARELSKRKVNTNPKHSDLDIAKSNARKMAKVITQPGKLIARMVAVRDQWPDQPDILLPFVMRVLELLPTSKYATAYRIGVEDGKFKANPEVELAGEDVLTRLLGELGLAPPPPSHTGTEGENIMYMVGYEKGLVSQEEFDAAAAEEAD